MDSRAQLRTFKHGNQLPWSDAQLLAGFQYFYELNGHYPAAGEIDSFPYLPSARSIQRSHGGLVALRKRLLPDQESDHTRGDIRRKIAQEGDKRARLYEEEFYYFLVDNFEEIAVHEHKIIRPGNVASDVFIYLNDTSKDGIVVDLFYAQDLITLLKIVNIKVKRYATLPFEVYFILVGNSAISNSSINAKISNKHIPLPPHISVVTEQSFKTTIVEALRARSKYTK